MYNHNILKLCRTWNVPYINETVNVVSHGSKKPIQKQRARIDTGLLNKLIEVIENDGLLAVDGRCLKLKRLPLIDRLKKYKKGLE